VVLFEGLEMDAPMGVEMDVVRKRCIASGRGRTGTGRKGGGFIMMEDVEST
jgi:hypothetical protein